MTQFDTNVKLEVWEKLLGELLDKRQIALASAQANSEDITKLEQRIQNNVHKIQLAFAQVQEIDEMIMRFQSLITTVHTAFADKVRLHIDRLIYQTSFKPDAEGNIFYPNIAFFNKNFPQDQGDFSLIP